MIKSKRDRREVLMNQNYITNSLLNEQEMVAAKTSVSMNIQRLEIAMNHLVERWNVTTQSVEQARKFVTAPKRIFLNAKGTVADFSKQTVATIKANPRPFVIAVIGFAGLGIVLYFAFRKSATDPQTLVKTAAKKIKNYL